VDQSRWGYWPVWEFLAWNRIQFVEMAWWPAALTVHMDGLESWGDPCGVEVLRGAAVREDRAQFIRARE
jgi:hypothetical protein